MKDKYIEEATRIYNINNWAENYFDVSKDGNFAYRVNADQVIEIQDIIEMAQKKSARLPILLRFKHILKSQVKSLHQAFAVRLKEINSQAEYLPVFPVKVNQRSCVVEEILASGNEQYNVGLEVGSKAELVLAIASCFKQFGHEPKRATIICNGYKDEDYLKCALIGKSAGLNIVLVIEKLNELQELLTLSNKMDIRPDIGLRVRLSSVAKGNWQNSGGEKSKFGLTSIHIMSAIELLKKENAMDNLKLLHFHLGSQLSDIDDIKRGLKEVGRYYSDICSMGINIQWLDIGGGLGVDYEGSRSKSYCSMNYSLEEYAHNVIHQIEKTCKENTLPMPGVITEAGRAMTAHHAVLVTQVADSEIKSGASLELQIKEIKNNKNSSSVVQELSGLVELIEDTNTNDLIELYHDINGTFQELDELYFHDKINLNQRAHGEILYQQACSLLLKNIDASSKASQKIIEELNEKTADKLILNFSVFRSMPDVWAINQIFPIVPLANLDKPINRRATLHDITCDSDGRIDDYINGERLEKTFPVSAENENKGSLIGFFLLGAYQEILGDNHNLLANTDAVDIEINEKGEVEVGEVIQGDSIDSVLNDVNYNSSYLKEILSSGLGRANLQKDLKQEYQNNLLSYMGSYTYLKL